jgi:Tfp pilus assembly protein PilO
MNSYKKFFNKDSSQVINTLNNIARDSSVKIISIKPQAEIILPIYTKCPFDLSINVDSYHILGRFISKIESYSDVYIVEKIDIKSVGQILRTGQEYKLDVNLRISAISLKD